MASHLGKRSRQRPKKYYGAKKQKVGGLEQLSAGMQGVLITTGDQEKLCVSEAYSLLNEYGDQLYGPEDLASPGDNDTDNEASGRNDDGIDMEAEVAKEVERLKGKDKDGKARQRRFQVVNTGAKHVVFIRCLEEVDPCQLVHHMLSDIAASGVKKSRFCQRILPVTKVCHASVNDLQRQADSVLQPHFHMDSLIVHKFAVNYKARNNNGVNRDEIIKLVASMVVKNGDFDHQVDLNNPDLTIVVEIIKNLCCLSVIKDFIKLKKYNLQSLVPPEPQKSNKATDSEKSAAKNTVEKVKAEDVTDKTVTDDQTAINVAGIAGDKTTCTTNVADEAASGDKTAVSDIDVAASAESSQKLDSSDTKPSTSTVTSTEMSSPTAPGVAVSTEMSSPTAPGAAGENIKDYSSKGREQ